MSHVHEGPLATYNSLLDPHLAGYFSNTHIRRHLRKSKLITRRGEVITEGKYRLLNARANHRKQVKDMLAQAIVYKTIDMERQRQAEVRKRLDRIAKLEMVKKVRAERKFGYEDTIMDLLRPPSEVRRQRRNSGKSCESLPQLSSRSGARSRSPGTSSLRSGGRPKTSMRRDYYDSKRRQSQNSGTRSRSTERGNSRNNRRRHDSASSTSSFDSRSMSSESHRDGHHITPRRASSRDRERSALTRSPYNEGVDHPPVAWKPHPPAKKPPPQTPRDEHGRPIGSKKHVRGRVILHRQEPAFKHEKEVQTFCDVTLKYLGGSRSHLLQQQIIVEQQHCGGNTLTVFKEHVKPKSNFTFVSKRHRGYPFGLTLYIDGHQDATVSTCCEYKHRSGMLLGSKSSHFLFVEVKGAKPCYKCQVEEELSSQSKKEKEEKEKKKQEEEKKEESEAYDDDFEGSDGEKKDIYDDDFEADKDDKASEKSDRSHHSKSSHSSRSSHRSPSPKSKRDHSDDELKTAREVQGFDDELEPKSVEPSSPRSSSSKKKSDRKSSSSSVKDSVEIEVHDSDDDYSSKEIIEHYFNSMGEGGSSPHPAIQEAKDEPSTTSGKTHNKANNNNSVDTVDGDSPKRKKKTAKVEAEVAQTLAADKDDDAFSVESFKSSSSKKSDRSDVSKKSDVSKRSDKSDTSKRSDKSDSSKRSGKSDTSKKSDKSDTSKKSDRSDVSKKSDKSDVSKKSDASKRSDKSEVSKKSDQSDASKKSDQSVTSSSSDATVKSAQSDNTVKSADQSPVATRTPSPPAEPSKPITENPFYLLATALNVECSRNSDGQITAIKRCTGSIQELVEVIGVNQDLMKLSMVDCSLDDNEAAELVEALKKSGCKLMELNLSGNKLGLRGGLALAHVLIEDKKSSLQHLRLSGNEISELPVTEIISALDSNNVNLQSLYLDNCIQSGGALSAQEGDPIGRLLSKPGAKLKHLALSHVTTETVQVVCEAVTKSKIPVRYLEFSSVIGLSGDANSSPLKLSSGSSVQTLSLINNNLSDANVKTFIKQWRRDKPEIKNVTIEPGNPDVTTLIKNRLLDYVRGVSGYDTPSDVTTSSSEDESDSESQGSPRTDSASQSAAADSAPQAVSAPQSQPPVMEKPPLPPQRRASFQSSVSAKSDLMSDSEKADSEKADSEKASSERSGGAKDSKVSEEKVDEGKSLPTGKDEARASSAKTSETDSSSATDSSSDFESETETENKKPRVTLNTSSDEAITPRASLALIKLGEDTDDDTNDITTIASESPLKELVSPHQSEIRLSQLTSDQLKEMCAMLRSNPNVKVLKLKETNLEDPADVLTLTNSLKDNRVLKTLVLADCGLNQDSCLPLAQLIKQHISTLEELSLRDNTLKDSGTEAVIKELSAHAEEAYNSSLRKQAKDIVSKSLADAVRSDSLASIATQGSDDGEDSLQTTLDPPAIRTLVLSNCKVGNATVAQIVELVKYGKVNDLRLSSSSGITQFGWKDLLTAVCSSQSSIKSLDISSNPIGKFGVVTGSPLLSLVGAELDCLNMSGCLLSNEHISSLEKELEKRTKIGNFKLAPGNDLSEDNIKRLQQACK